jgi:hypothetical protein
MADWLRYPALTRGLDDNSPHISASSPHDPKPFLNCIPLRYIVALVRSAASWC